MTLITTLRNGTVFTYENASQSDRDTALFMMACDRRYAKRTGQRDPMHIVKVELVTTETWLA